LQRATAKTDALIKEYQDWKAITISTDFDLPPTTTIQENIS